MKKHHKCIFVPRLLSMIVGLLFSREHLVVVELRYHLIIGAQSKLSYSCLKVIHANYISNIIVQPACVQPVLKNCAYSLRGKGSAIDQQAPNKLKTSSRHKFRFRNNLPSHAMETRISFTSSKNLS